MKRDHCLRIITNQNIFWLFTFYENFVTVPLQCFKYQLAHPIMKARITITAFVQDHYKPLGKRKIEETEPDSNLTRDSNWARTMSKLHL